MTEQRTDRSNWTLEQQARHWFEMQEQRNAWFAQKKHEREQQERQQKQAALERHLHERSQEYLDYTGAPPSTSLLENWQAEYVTNQARQREAERAERLAQIEAEHYDRLHGGG